MAVEVYGVDATFVAAYLPQVTVTATGPLTSARLTELIEGAAAIYNGRLIARFGAGTPATIGADATTDAYRNAQNGIITLATPQILMAAHHLAADVLAAQEAASELLDLIDHDPIAATGYTSDESYSPGVATSTAGLGLSTTTASRRDRRAYDGATSATGKDEGGFIW